MKEKKRPGPKGGNTVTTKITGKCVGRNNVVIVPNEVYKLAALGCKNIDIANFFGVTSDAISRHFAGELQKGREDVKISLRRAMLQNACTNHNAAVQIFLAKNMLGMSDNGEVDGEDKKPLPWESED